MRNAPLTVDGTPVERHQIGPHDVMVKREDLASPYPGPMFSKIRGVVAHIRSRPEQTVGVLDTFHSRAGWAVSFVCAALGRRCLNFYPLYKRDDGALRPQQQEAESNGALLVPLQATASWHLFHQATALMRGRGYMMPNALKLIESVTETELEADRTPELDFAGTVILPISSGTIAGGVIRNLLHRKVSPVVYLHLGYSRSAKAVSDYIEGLAPGAGQRLDIRLVDEQYAYKDTTRNPIELAFPASPYYDGKAAAWLSRVPAGDFPGPIIFWNIGA